MIRQRDRLSRGLCRATLGFAAIAVLIAAGTAPADARRRHHHSHTASPQHKYHPAEKAGEPRYADIVVDINSGQVLHESNPDSLRHPASLTKIMTLFLLFEQLDTGKLKLTTPLNVSAHAASQPPTKLGLKAGQTIAVEDAIKAMVTESANDMAVVVAEAVGGDEDTFARLMTRKAHALGMARTVYVNASGLPAEEQLTTARDQALLGRAIQERFPTYYRYFATTSFRYHGRAMRNHNHLLGNVAGVDGIKTGYTRSSGFNLVTSVRRGNRHIVAVVLGGTTGGARDARMRALIDEHIAAAATKRTAPVLAENETRAARPKPRNAEPANARPDATTTSAVNTSPAPRPGSAEPIHPISVKTINVKPGPVQTAGLAPLVATAPQSTMAPQWAARPQPPNPPPVAAVPEAAVPPPPSPRPGSLGTLPVRSAVLAPATEAAPPTARPAAAASLVSRATVAPSQQNAEEPAPPEVAPATAPHNTRRGEWMIQIGAFEDETQAKERLKSAQSMAQSLLANADGFTERVMKGAKELYRARFAGLDRDSAEAACQYFKRNDIACMTLKN